jgi:hypothetical protein
VSYGVGSGAATIEVTDFAASNPAICAPCIIDDEQVGVGSALDAPHGVGMLIHGGNAVNHPASPAYESIHTLLLDNFAPSGAAGGTPVQSITAAAAISSQDVTLVKLTGPATSTYAITLAAPSVTDQGRVMMIEMIATTATNAVTMALTNCSGGTAAASCSWSAAGHKLVLMAGSSKWEVIKQDGVTLT